MPLNDALIFTEQKQTKPQCITHPSKMEALLNAHSTSNVISNHLRHNELYNCQGQKWQSVLDFDKMLKQIRNAEKSLLRGKNISSDNNVKNHSQANSPTNQIAPPKRQVIQVQRLNADDMHYYDIVPKQTARDVVICNTCNGYYTKMGFHNHVMIHHPSIWSSTSTKYNIKSTHDLQRSTESSVDMASDVTSGSPTDMSGTLSTCSNNSTSSSSLCSPYATVGALTATVPIAITTASTISTSSSTTATNSRHKSSTKSSSSKSGSSSSSSGAGRSRSKSKHHHASSSSSSTEMSQNSSKSSSGSSSKKSSSSSNAAAATTAQHASAAIGTASLVLINSSKVIGQESADSTTSSSSSEFDHKNLASSKSRLHLKAATKPGSAGQPPPPPYDLQASELDQAVSSITGDAQSSVNRLDTVDELQNMATTLTHINPSSSFQQQNQTTELTSGGILATQSCDEHMQQNTSSNDNSISLTNFDDMFDSKFINDILSTAESEIQFDESVLDPTLQQTSGVSSGSNYQPPASKRMRYVDLSTIGGAAVGTVTTNEIVGEFAVYQQQQQPQQQQFLPYDHNSLEDIKIFGSHNVDISNQQQQQQQHQQPLTTMDAMQLQQLLYQQQQQQTSYDAPQQQQFEPNSNLLNLCAADSVEQQHKRKLDIDEKLLDFTTYEQQQQQSQQQSSANTAQTYSVYNVQSLTDDNVEGTQLEHMMMPNIIYEISSNNQVAVMDQQHQQQVIAEFLTQAGYDNVEQMNVLTSAGDGGGVENNNDPTRSSDISELGEFDFSNLETVQTLSSSSSSSSSSESKIPSVKLENSSQTLAHTKHHDDYYLNLFMYAGVPRPLAMNSFGLLKLPQCAATTFRKNLLTTRKANNNLLSISGGGGGIVGGINGVMSSGNSGTRYPIPNSKQNYTIGSGSNASIAHNNNSNEFSIGSITITNNNQNNNHNNNIAQQTAYSPVEISSNLSPNGGTSPLQQTQQRSRIKSNSNNIANVNAATTGLGNNKHKPMPATITVMTPTSRHSSIGSTAASVGSVLNAKTIYVNKTPANTNERNLKCMKRSIISKVELTKNSNFSVKKLNDLLSGKTKEKDKQQTQQQQVLQSENIQQQQQSQQNNDSSEQQNQQQQHNKKSRVQSFYERRRKLLNMSTIYSGNNNKNNNNMHLEKQTTSTYAQQQHQQKLLKQQLMRTLNDCGINSIAQWKNNNNNPGNNATNNDLMRVFV